jgi:uncharacterized protein (DUF2249 family)
MPPACQPRHLRVRSTVGVAGQHKWEATRNCNEQSSVAAVRGNIHVVGCCCCCC